ncbi:PTS sugar transporter [Microbacterium sp. cx-55]|uniref:PTS sugar transporter subunit IIB n=1 Tax=unclassified Microbacterium TaxID=2609290 RepID=UPI001CBE7A89|nr:MULTISPECIES: PTS sugar transporter [unclassified Microbacterium]MBZ4487059.1 PTS sugar transporter [Microbacterium sp. cx-55]MCC4907874.1 PTS sugar transporter [Microbacterium sp. cx-59]UGB35976.1 PTS sugar transporter [Microbacterium sp. cx-55]
MRILVVCGAGASSTFVAQRLRRAALDSGLHYDAAPVSRSALAARLGEAEIVLIGPHLTDAIDDIRTDAAAYSVPVILLPEDIFTDRDGARTLRLVTEAAGGVRAAEVPDALTDRARKAP